jgi:hypothetical protein
LAVTADNGIDSRGKDERKFPPQLHSVRDTQNGIRFKPVQYLCPIYAAYEFADAKVLFRHDLHAYIAGSVIAGGWSRFTDQPEEDFRCGWGIPNSR